MWRHVHFGVYETSDGVSLHQDDSTNSLTSYLETGGTWRPQVVKIPASDLSYCVSPFDKGVDVLPYWPPFEYS